MQKLSRIISKVTKNTAGAVMDTYTYKYDMAGNPWSYRGFDIEDDFPVEHIAKFLNE